MAARQLGGGEGGGRCGASPAGSVGQGSAGSAGAGGWGATGWTTRGRAAWLGLRTTNQNPTPRTISSGSHGARATASRATPWPKSLRAPQESSKVRLTRSPKVGVTTFSGGLSGTYFCFSTSVTLQVVRAD